MKDDTFTILASVIIGILQMVLLFGYNVMGFAVESVMHSVKGRCPDCIIDFAGYYGQCLVYIVYTLSNLLAPAILHTIGIRKTLIVASLCFLAYTSSFLYIHNFVYFPAAILAGFAFPLYYVGAGTYSAKHSTDATFSRNQAIFWTVAQICFLLTGLLMIASSEFSSDRELQLDVTSAKGYRHYSENEIDLLTYGSMAMACIALVIAAFLPMRNIPNSIFNPANRKSFREQLGLMFSTMMTSKMFLLVPLHCFGGMYIAFWLTIYPTTVAFTSEFAEHKHLIGYICISLTFGEVLLGLIISYGNRKFANFGQWPVLWMTVASFGINMVVLVLFSPPLASIRPTDGLPILGTSIGIPILMGVLNGIVDGCLNNVRMVACAKVLPENPAISFSISKFYQGAACATFYYVSSIFTVYQLAGLLSGTLALGVIGYALVMRLHINVKQIKC
ncbi:unnamed protein product, partial [Mesorhabditis spiculigera]